LAAAITVVLLPFLAVLDVTRKLAGQRLRRLRLLTVAPRVETPAPVAPVQASAPPATTAPQGTASPAPARRDTGHPAPRRVDRRSAADTMASVSSPKPFRVADHVS